MKPALVLAFALFVSVLSHGAQETPGGATSAQSPTAVERAREALDASKAALGRGEASVARERAAEAVKGLLASSEAQEDAEWLELLDAAGSAAMSAGDARTADAAWSRALSTLSRAVPIDPRRLIGTSMDVASAREALGDWKGVVELMERLLTQLLRELPPDHLDVHRARGELASALHSAREFPRARELQVQVLEALAKSLPADHVEVLMSRGNLALTLHDMGEYESARAQGRQVLDGFLATLPLDHPRVQIARRNLALTEMKLDGWERARDLLRAALDVNTRTLLAHHPRLLVTRGDLALCLFMLGDFAGAREQHERVLAALQERLDESHPDLQQARENLAKSSRALGDLHGALALQQRVESVRARTLPPDHPDLASIRMELGISKDELGDHEGARILFQSVMESRSRALPPEDTALLWAKGNLALALVELGDLQAARALQEEILGVFERARPPEHVELQHARGNLAWTLRLLGELERARRLEEDVLATLERTLPEGAPDLERARENLALTRMAGRDTKNALPLQERVVADRARRLPPEHDDLIAARVNLVAMLGLDAVLHPCRHATCSTAGACSQNPRPVEETLELCASEVAAARRSVFLGSAREAEAYCARLARGLDVALSLERGYGRLAPAPKLAEAAFRLSETTRGAGLVSAALARRGAGAPAYTDARRALLAASERLARDAQTGTTGAAFDRARSVREAAERELLEIARALSGGEVELHAFDASALAARLGPLSAAVAFRGFTRWSFDTADTVRETRVRSLCAFVVRGAPSAPDGRRMPDTDAILVHLGPVEPIEGAVRDWRAAIGAGVERGRVVSAGSRSEVQRRGDELRRLVFDPLLAALGDAERVVFVLDDVLHLVPLDALPLADGQKLIGDQLRIETRATLAELLSEPASLDGSALVALGGAAFNSAPLELTAEDEAEMREEVTPQTPALLRGTAWERGFTPLTHAGEEVRAVGALYQEVFEGKRPALVLEKRKASRAALPEVAPRARFLHVATHGWYAPESVRSWGDAAPEATASGGVPRGTALERVRGTSPMLLCGLALAGANLPEDQLGRSRGLLTADELSTLDLSNCELAVLSACDTNVGERRAGQGVASLQKALHMAGARSVITSLWKVPDEATKELMLDFYRRLWVEEKPKRQALWEAKRRLREAKDERGDPAYSLRDWAAWVLTGEPD